MKENFRSNLEKRWAEVFNELEIEYEYESKRYEVTFHLQKKTYIPDFYLPKQDLIIEVKAPHKWEGRGLEKSRELAHQGFKVLVCKDNGKFFYLGEHIHEGKILKCKNCGKYFFSEKIDSKCIYCNEEETELFATGEDGIPHWFNNNKEKWLFDETEYQKMFNSSDHSNHEKLENIHNHLEGIPEIIRYSKSMKEEIFHLFEKYPNMEEVKNFLNSFMDTMELRNDDSICFQPLLLVGSAGCGKTSFATELSQIMMGRQPIKLELGNGITYFDIVGTSPDMNKATCGKVLKAMFSESPKPPIKNPIIVIDEFEKYARDEYSPETVFYTLFERKSSEIFTDCFFGIPIDASRVNYISTANSIDRIPLPILNRMKVIYVRDNTEKEMKNVIIPNIYKSWLEKENIKRNRVPKFLSSEIIDKVYERTKGDIRKISTVLSELLLEYKYFDNELQEYISLFTKNERKDWQSLTDITDFSEEWKLKSEDKKSLDLETLLKEIDNKEMFA